MDSHSKQYYWHCWQLQTDNGRQVWQFTLPHQLRNTIKKEEDWTAPEGQQFLSSMMQAFAFDKSKNANSADLVYRTQAEERAKENKASKNTENLPIAKAINNGFGYYEKLQTKDGHWPGDYGGPLFLTPGLVFVTYIAKQPFPAPYNALLKQYFFNHQNADGGWGLHIEDHSTMFGTVMQYVALRLLGVDTEDARMQKAKQWIHAHGDATGIAPWGKFYLSVLGLYEWHGNDSLLPEMWILPRWLPVHPGRFWNHCRMVYLPMSFCYGKNFSLKDDALIKKIRSEIYTTPYSDINWKKTRQKCTKTDVYKPVSKIYQLFYVFINMYEKIHFKKFRKKALKFIYSYIKAEDEHTKHVNLGPVNKVINALAVFIKEGGDSPDFKKHVDRLYDYLWLAEDGMKMSGYNGSQLWDTAFACQALCDSNQANNFPQMSRKIYNYLDVTQVREDVKERKKYFRTQSKGGWPFSTRDHGWPITDCTAEGLKSVIALNNTQTIQSSNLKLITEERLQPTVDLILWMQNKSGGWASYEDTRAPKWLEKLNPSMIFGDIMIDYNYVECSSACLQGLVKFTKTYPNYRTQDIATAIEKGRQYINKIQRKDGSWYGSWGVCFTYGTWFAIEGLMATGAKGFNCKMPDKSIENAGNFLLSIQKKDGSWGESFQSCVDKRYVEHEKGQVVNTAWALLGLLAAKHPDKKAIDAGIQFLIKMQKPNGDWPQQGISGVFNGNCMITYTAYRNVFPLWALGRYNTK